MSPSSQNRRPAMRRTTVCSIIPPHILRNIAERGDDDARTDAQRALELTEQTRGMRIAIIESGAMMAVSTGEKRRTIYDAQHARTLPGKRVRGEADAAVRDIAVNEA